MCEEVFDADFVSVPPVLPGSPNSRTFAPVDAAGDFSADFAGVFAAVRTAVQKLATEVA